MSKDHTHAYLNFRPIELPKRLRQVLEEQYKQYNAVGSLTVALLLLVKDGCYDINVSPDKREVFLSDEAELFAKFETALGTWLETQQRALTYEEPK